MENPGRPGKKERKGSAKGDVEDNRIFYYYYFTETTSKVNLNLWVVWDQTDFLV